MKKPLGGGTCPKTTFTFLPLIPALLLLPACATRISATGSPAGPEPRLASQDFVLHAGRPSPVDCYPRLLRVERSGHAIFRLDQEEAFIVRAAPQDFIPEGESDFYGRVLRTDPSRQSAIIRQYDLGKPL